MDSVKLISFQMYEPVMPERLDMSIWRRFINFRAYKFSQEITFNDLLDNLKKRKGDYENRSDGWAIEDGYFPRFKTEDDLSYFIYMHFVRDGNASRVQGSDAYHHYPIGCAVDFKNKLIIVSTSAKDALRGLVEEEMFEPIRALTNIDSYTYNGEFLLWLAYTFGKIPSKKINDEITIEDVKAISSEHDTENRQNVSQAVTRVTEYPETKVMLGLGGFATGIKSKFKSQTDIYELNLYTDGRILAKNSAKLEEIEEKTLYAIDIHNMIQESFSEFNNFIKEKDWNKIKVDYQLALLDEAMESVRVAIEAAKESVKGASGDG